MMFFMFDKYIHYLLEKAEYTKDESGYIFAQVPWYQGFYSQWEDIEKARENLINAIEGIIFLKLQNKDWKLIEEMKSFIYQDELEYA